MTVPFLDIPESRAFRYAGLLYLTVIVLGLGAELGLRAPINGSADPSAALLLAPHVPGMSLLADILMIAADVALAVMLFILFAPTEATWATFAALFRLVQAVVLAANLTHLQDSAISLGMGDADAAIRAMELHAAGYDLGLVFFGIACFFTGALVIRDARMPAWLGAMIVLTGAVYITGTALRIAAHDLFASFQPAYLIAIVTEVAFAIVLFKNGFERERSDLSKA